MRIWCKTPSAPAKAAGAMVLKGVRAQGLCPVIRNSGYSRPLGGARAALRCMQCPSAPPAQPAPAVHRAQSPVVRPGRVVAAEAAVLGIHIHQRDAAAGLERVTKACRSARVSGTWCAWPCNSRWRRSAQAGRRRCPVSVVMMLAKPFSRSTCSMGAGAVQRGDLRHMRGDGGRQQAGACQSPARGRWRQGTCASRRAKNTAASCSGWGAGYIHGRRYQKWVGSVMARRWLVEHLFSMPSAQRAPCSWDNQRRRSTPDAAGAMGNQALEERPDCTGTA